jgi:hypothetical protein
MRWLAGDPIAWRIRVRITPGDSVGDLAMVFPMTVVHDEPDELAVFRGPGAVGKRRNTEKGGPHGRVVLAVRDGFEDYPWHTWRVLILRQPAAKHSVSLFWNDVTNELHFWYIDLVSPLRRTRSGFEFVEHGIDVVVDPDMTSWHWKDTDELEWYVEHGRYTADEADAIRAEAERAVARLAHEREQYEPWVAWRPNPAWQAPALPTGWDA